VFEGPSGSFWKISRNLSQSRKSRVRYIHACHTIHNYEFKIKKRDE